MDIKKIPEILSLSEHPVALGGCRNTGNNFDCCEYNINVFDGKIGESIHDLSGIMVKLHHCSLAESDASALIQMENLNVLHDEQWNLRMFLAKIKDKKEKILNSYTQNCLVEAGILANKAREAVKTKEPFAAIWVKCAAYFLADALFSINSKRPSPTHMLEMTRNLQKNETNQTFSMIHQILGVERASTSVLARMIKSTMGFSDMVENNGHSRIIQRKYDYLVKNSLLSDCYFYLGYVNKSNVMKVKNRIHKNPEYIHVLRIALDIDSDQLVVDKQSSALLQRVNELVNVTDNK